MDTLSQRSHLSTQSSRYRNPFKIIVISIIMAAVVGFAAGRIVESVLSGQTMHAYQLQIQELMQQVSECGKEMDSQKLSALGESVDRADTKETLVIHY